MQEIMTDFTEVNLTFWHRLNSQWRFFKRRKSKRFWLSRSQNLLLKTRLITSSLYSRFYDVIRPLPVRIYTFDEDRLFTACLRKCPINIFLAWYWTFIDISNDKSNFHARIFQFSRWKISDLNSIIDLQSRFISIWYRPEFSANCRRSFFHKGSCSFRAA